MVLVPGGTFLMGSDRHYPEEAPAHRVTVDGFWMDRTPVTNRQYRRFVEDTGYTTFAEIAPDPAQYPGALPEMLQPASVVFVKTTGPVDLRNHFNWWQFVAGADWRHPQGPESSIEDMDDHPVVHVALTDVEATCTTGWSSMPSIELSCPCGWRQSAPAMNCHQLKWLRRSTRRDGLRNTTEAGTSISGSAPG